MRRQLLIFFSAILGACAVLARDNPVQSNLQGTGAAPAYCTATHDVGRMSLLLTNGGTIGTGMWPADNSFVSPYAVDSSGCHLGRVVYGSDWWGAEYPLGTGMKVLRVGALWVGGVTETGDTLVSTGYVLNERSDWLAPTLELHPPASPDGDIGQRSLASDDRFDPARSDQDYTIVYTDTVTRGVPGLDQDYIAHRWHRPLGIKVTQRSSQWSSPMADDFVLIEYTVENIGLEPLRNVYAGLYLELAIGLIGNLERDWVNVFSQLCGTLDTFPASGGCGGVDTLRLIWMTDNSGGADETNNFVPSGPTKSHRSATAMQMLQAPDEADRPSFNWWSTYWRNDPSLDYGPRHKPVMGMSERSFGHGGTGTPLGDANKYYVMDNGEWDLDLPRLSQIQPNDPLWEYPLDVVRQWIGPWGDAINCLMSVGPLQLARGEEKSFVVAYVGAERFHNDPTNWQRLRDGDIDGWYANVDFAPLAKNFRQAKWTFDNPGFDTDGDGYAGKFHVCVLDSQLVDGVWVPKLADTSYYEGDGVPDWRAVGPPPAPKTWLVPTLNGIRVRFNGQRSETTKDLVSNRLDFEGYNVYLGRDDREASLSLAATLDRANYDKLVLAFGEWRVGDVPYSLDELRCRYGLAAEPCNDSSFDPLVYTMASPLRLRGFESDSVFAFARHGYNAGLAVSGIRKLYPDVPEPMPGEELPPDQVTADGYPKFYEYECTVENLLPTVPYYVNVTAFDYGDPASEVEALESSKTLGLQTAYPLADRNQTGDSLAPAYVYPNPYYADGRYALEGFEDRYKRGANPDRERLIHFVNVPARCIIRIHTLDGDLVRALNHDVDPSDPNSHHETWDLINRNIQTVESGLYYWSVEDASGRVQLGKLVIIR